MRPFSVFGCICFSPTYGLWGEASKPEMKRLGIKSLGGSLGKFWVTGCTLEGRWIHTSAPFGPVCQGHNLILSLVWMTESLMGLLVSRSGACGLLAITQKPQRHFGLGKRAGAVRPSVRLCERQKRPARGKCAQTHSWTEP